MSTKFEIILPSVRNDQKLTEKIFIGVEKALAESVEGMANNKNMSPADLRLLAGHTPEERRSFAAFSKESAKVKFPH